MVDDQLTPRKAADTLLELLRLAGEKDVPEDLGSWDEAVSVFRRVARRVHPDRAAGSMPDAEKRMAQANGAHSVLAKYSERGGKWPVPDLPEPDVIVAPESSSAAYEGVRVAVERHATRDGSMPVEIVVVPIDHEADDPSDFSPQVLLEIEGAVGPEALAAFTRTFNTDLRGMARRAMAFVNNMLGQLFGESHIFGFGGTESHMLTTHADAPQSQPPIVYGRHGYSEVVTDPAAEAPIGPLPTIAPIPAPSAAAPARAIVFGHGVQATPRVLPPSIRPPLPANPHPVYGHPRSRPMPAVHGVAPALTPALNPRPVGAPVPRPVPAPVPPLPAPYRTPAVAGPVVAPTPVPAPAPTPPAPTLQAQPPVPQHRFVVDLPEFQRWSSATGHGSQCGRILGQSISPDGQASLPGTFYAWIGGGYLQIQGVPHQLQLRSA